ncbi:hypothetical protein D3C76_1741380 [compost metagenome]
MYFLGLPSITLLFGYWYDIIIFFQRNPFIRNISSYILAHITDMPRLILISCNVLLSFWKADDITIFSCMLR